MTRDEFMNSYDAMHRMLVTYTDLRDKSTRKGIALDKPHATLSGIHAVYVDSFANPVKVTQIHKVENTGRKW